MSNIDKRAQKELYATVEKQAHKLRGNPIAYQVVTGMCPVNVIEMQAKKIQALLDELAFLDKRNAELNSTLERWAVDRAQSASELEAAEKRIAELESDFDRKYAPLDEELMNLHRWFWEQSEAERAAAAGKGE